MKSIFVLLFAVLLAGQFVYAEPSNTQVRVSIKLDRPIAMESPMVNPGGRNIPFRPKNWMFLEAKMNVQAAPVPKTGYLDNMTVRFHLAAKNPEGRGYLVMTKDIKYVNIPVGNDVYVCVFMSPSAVKKLTGSETVGGSMFSMMAVEVLYNDRVVSEDSKGRAGWWKIQSPSIVATSSYPLLNKNETPFAMFWYDRYPEIAPSKNDGGSAPSEPAPAETAPAAPARPVTPAAPATPTAPAA